MNCEIQLERLVQIFPFPAVHRELFRGIESRMLVGDLVLAERERAFAVDHALEDHPFSARRRVSRCLFRVVSPSNIEHGGKVANWPIVDLTIEKDGKVVRTSVISRSGNRAVDDAVTTFLANLKVVPAPPQAAVIRVTLEIQ